MRNGYEEGKFKEGIVMKANTPEKIYLQEPTKVRTEKKYDNDIEYTRTDAFIEKAEEFFEEYLTEEDCKFGASEWVELKSNFESMDSFIRAFENYIKKQ